MQDLNPYYLNIKKMNAELDERMRAMYNNINQQFQELSATLGNSLKENEDKMNQYITDQNNLTEEYKTKSVELTNQNEQIENFTNVAFQAPQSEFIQSMEEKINENYEVVRTVEELEQNVLNAENGAVFTVDPKVLEESIKRSVNPKAKVKYKPKSQKILKVGAYVAAAVIALATIKAGANELSTRIHQSEVRTEALNEYAETIYKPNTNEWVEKKADGFAVPEHSHSWETIIQEVHQKYEDPLIGFYMIYTRLDTDCRQSSLNNVFGKFNLYYGTNYTSLEDLLSKNNFQEYKELAKYVSYELSKLEEANTYDGSRDSAIRR